jgi:hypothetical protein
MTRKRRRGTRVAPRTSPSFSPTIWTAVAPPSSSDASPPDPSSPNPAAFREPEERIIMDEGEDYTIVVNDVADILSFEPQSLARNIIARTLRNTVKTVRNLYRKELAAGIKSDMAKSEEQRERELADAMAAFTPTDEEKAASKRAAELGPWGEQLGKPIATASVLEESGHAWDAWQYEGGAIALVTRGPRGMLMLGAGDVTMWEDFVRAMPPLPSLPEEDGRRLWKQLLKSRSGHRKSEDLAARLADDVELGALHISFSVTHLPSHLESERTATFSVVAESKVGGHRYQLTQTEDELLADAFGPHAELGRTLMGELWRAVRGRWLRKLQEVAYQTHLAELRKDDGASDEEVRDA